MNKKILLLCILTLLLISGCTDTSNKNDKKNTPEDLDIIVPEGSITFKCTKIIQDDDLAKITVIDTSHFDKKQQLINRKVKTIEEYKTQEEFEKMIAIYSQVEHTNTKKIKYVSQAYNDEKTFAWIRAEIGNINTKTTLIFQDAKMYLLDIEGKGYDCKITGATREELQLK